MRTNRQYKSSGILAVDVIETLIAGGYQLTRHSAPEPDSRRAEHPDSRRTFGLNGTDRSEGCVSEPKASVRRQARETQQAIQKILGGPLDAVVSTSGLSVYFNKTSANGCVSSVAVPVKGHVVGSQLVAIKRETGLSFGGKDVQKSDQTPRTSSTHTSTEDPALPDGNLEGPTRRRLLSAAGSPWMTFQPGK